MSEKNYEYFKSNLPQLLDKYHEKYVVICDENVLGVYRTFDEAFEDASKTRPSGTFIIQHCVKENSSNVTHFAWNNVAFPSLKA